MGNAQYELTTEELLETITEDDIISLMEDLDNGDYHRDEEGNLKFRTVCHGGGSYKLYYYTDTKQFQCYTGCGHMSIFGFLMSVYDWDFLTSFNFLKRFKGIDTSGIRKQRGFSKYGTSECADWDFINKYKRAKKKKIEKLELMQNIDSILPHYDHNNMRKFDNLYPSSWESEDNISIEAMEKFNIRFFTIQWKAVIPHYDINGNLIGIRGRSFLKRDLENGQKYMPIYYGQTNYRHPLQFNLYGIYENQENIRRNKKIILFEGEKAVMQCESYFPDNNFAVALCGSNMSNYQRNLILSLGVDEVFIALDKQYKTELESDADYKEYDQYVAQVKKIADKLVNYVNVYIIYEDGDLLEYKDSPSDKGGQVLIDLMRKKNKYNKVKD